MSSTTKTAQERCIPAAETAYHSLNKRSSLFSSPLQTTLACIDISAPYKPVLHLPFPRHMLGPYFPWLSSVQGNHILSKGKGLLLCGFECLTKSEQGTLCLRWKSRGANIVSSPNRTEVESCAEGLTINFLFPNDLFLLGPRFMWSTSSP